MGLGLMANPQKGEAELVVGDDTYTLRLSYNAIAEIEVVLAMPFPAIAAQIGEPSGVPISMWRALLWGALRQHHPKLSLLDAGEIMQATGLQVIVERLGEALRLAFPEPTGADARPQ